MGDNKVFCYWHLVHKNVVYCARRETVLVCPYIDNIYKACNNCMDCKLAPRMGATYTHFKKKM